MVGWKRNLYIICAAELVAILGFSVSFPFLPLFVQELGVTDLEQVEIWSGTLLTSGAIAMAVFSPIWGSVADRIGRKLMLERAMFGGALMIGAMGLVANVQQLLVLRVLQGCVTGTVAAATTLVASMTPRRKMGYSLGLIQMAVFSGASTGPLLGGVLADLLGFRPVFWITGAMLLAAGLTVLMLVEERFEPTPENNGPAVKGFLRDICLIARSKVLVAIIVVMLSIQVGETIVRPILPLFVQSLNPAEERVASIAGVILGVAALTSALAAVMIGRISDRIGHRRALICCVLGVAALYVPQAFVKNSAQLLVLRAALGAFLGGTIPTANAVIAAVVPDGKQGSTYGVSSSATSLGKAIGPIVGATIAATLGMRSVFLCTAIIFTLVSIWIASAVAVPQRAR